MKENVVIESTDASCEEEFMSETWIIEDTYQPRYKSIACVPTNGNIAQLWQQKL